MQKSSFLLLVVVFVSALSCARPELHRKAYKTTNAELYELNKESEELKSEGVNTFLKVHCHDGSVYIFHQNWKADSSSRTLSGFGEHYDFKRRFIGDGNFDIPYSDISLLVTNAEQKQIKELNVLVPLAIANVALSAFCIANPKACFGSCPTFYPQGETDWGQARAEGFSNAILPSLEYGDVDALRIPPYRGEYYELTMKNEAQETHAVRQVELWAVPTAGEAEIVQSRSNSFFPAYDVRAPLRALHSDGSDLSALLSSTDEREYSSPADAENLISREEIILEWENLPEGDSLGLVLDFRQSLMTTYFIYSALGYMGEQMSDILAQADREASLYETMDRGLKSELGELEVWLWQEAAQEWRLEGSFYETGPIAINRQVLPLRKESSAKELKLKLRFNRGLWRIDAARLARLGAPLAPICLQAKSVNKNGRAFAAGRESLLDSSRYLTSLPGESYQMRFAMPSAAQDYQLFVYSKGYYLEWMRHEWVENKNLWKLYQMFERPKSYLRSEAAAYKAYEQNMEEIFWSSQVQTKNAAR